MPGPFSSPLAEYHLSRGASLAEYHGALVPVRYSDLRAEHTAVRRAAGIFDLSFRARFAASGQDRVGFLHNMLSNDVKGLAPGQGIYATLLNVKGHVLADLRVYCEHDRILVETDADLRGKTMDTLGRYIIMDDVSLEPLGWFGLGVEGPRSGALIAKSLNAALPVAAEFAHVSSPGQAFHIVRASSAGEEGYEVWVPLEGGAEPAKALWQAVLGEAASFGALPCGTEALEVLRIEAGIPRYGVDFGEDTLPLEAGLLNALSFTKGCYPGQEIVERARSRGHVNWKLVGVVAATASLPASGEKITAEGREVGEVTSTCFSLSLDRHVAFAYVRREVSEPGTMLTLASGAGAEVRALPFYRRPQLESN